MHALGKVAKRLVVRIGPAQLIFILTDKETKANDVTGWCEFSVNELFLEYVMEGLTPEDNEIYLDVSAGMVNVSFFHFKNRLMLIYKWGCRIFIWRLKWSKDGTI